MQRALEFRNLSLPYVRFLVVAVCLLPLGVFLFHSEWPPFGWVPVHFADADVGETILAYSGFFLFFAVAYYFFPILVHRRLNPLLSRLHFWLSMLAFLSFLALPIYYNLTFHSRPGEGKLDLFFREFGAGFGSLALALEFTALVQVVFLANVLWSFFKGERQSARVQVPDTLEGH